MLSTLLPPEYSPPAAVVTSTDHGGWITITTALGLLFVLFFLALRVFIRTGISPRFGYDDTVLGIATVRTAEQPVSARDANGKQVTSVAQAAVVFLQVSKGFGKSHELLRPPAIVEIQKVGVHYRLHDQFLMNAGSVR